MTTSRSVILYIATSLDGYVAGPNDDLSFLSLVQRDGEDYGYGNFIDTVDTVILGRRTYDWVMQQVKEFPHASKQTYVVTRTARPAIGSTVFYTGNLRDLVLRLKSEPGETIFIDGGAQIASALLKEQLIDEIILSVIPVLLGEGIRLFTDGRPGQNLTLISAKNFDSGLVQLHYRCT